MKKSIITVAIAVACVAGFVCHKTYKNHTMSARENLIKKNIEAITRGEWDGWIKGFTMKPFYRLTGGGISVGGNGGGINVSGEWINCCVKASEYDACNMSASNLGC